MPIVRADLRAKHKLMSSSAFRFLRGTFYRWVQIWRETVPEVARAPKLLAVGDVHLENFGTWRDSEGRLVWGINDFDETYRLPYTLDLVRLVVQRASGDCGRASGAAAAEASEAVLAGYTRFAERGRIAFVPWGSVTAGCAGLPRSGCAIPWNSGERSRRGRRSADTCRRRCCATLQRMMPAPAWKPTASGASRAGQPGPRASLADCGVGWRKSGARGEGAASQRLLLGGETPERLRSSTRVILERAVRVPDPFVHVFGRWLLRRLAPDCSRIEIDSLPAKRDEERLLYAMGWETANIHLGSQRVFRR